MCTAAAHVRLPRSWPDALCPDGGMFYVSPVQLIVPHDVHLRTFAATFLPPAVLSPLLLLGLQGQ